MQPPNNPLHGKTLEIILSDLVAYYGSAELGNRIRINCFLLIPLSNQALSFSAKRSGRERKVLNFLLTSRCRWDKLSVTSNKSLAQLHENSLQQIILPTDLS